MSNLTTATTDSVARFVAAEGDPQAYGFKLTRRWEKVHAAYVDSLIVALNSVKRYTDPKADKQSYTGTFIQAQNRPEVDREDAIEVVQTLVKVRTQATDSNAQFVAQEGDPLHAGYRLSREWPYFDPNAADTCFTAEWAKLSYINPKADGQAYTGTFAHSSLTPQKAADKTVTLRQTLTKTKSATDSSDADLIRAEGDPTTAGSSITRAWHYIDPTSVDDRYAALNAISSYSSGIKASGQLYAGKYVVSRVRPVETEDRTFRIEQENTKVRVVGGDTSLLNPLKERRKNEIHPFGEGRGTSYSIVFKYLNLDPAGDTKLMAISDATLEGKMGAGYDLIDRKTIVEENRTLTFWMLSEKKTRIAWSNAIYKAPDHLNRDNPNRDDEQLTKVWFGIDNSYDTKARADIKSDTLVAVVNPGYTLLGYKQQDNDDGSDDWQQTIVKTHNDTRTDSSIIAPHSIEFVTVQNKHSEFRNYKAANMPADPAITSGYDFVEKQQNLNANGLLDKVFVQRKPTASNAVSSGKPARVAIIGHINKQVDTLAGNVIEQEFDRIPIGDADTALVYGRIIAGDTYIVEQARYRDLGDGSASLTRKVKRVNHTAKYFIQEIQVSNGYASASAVRVWPNLNDTKAAKILVDSAVDTFHVTVNGVATTYPPLRAERTRHEDGTSTIRQFGGTQKSGYSAAGTGNTDSVLKVDFIFAPRGVGERKRTVFYKSYSSDTTAVAFVQRIDAATDKPFGRNEGYVKQNGSDFDAYKVKFTAP
jgi:hypothetical protein